MKLARHRRLQQRYHALLLAAAVLLAACGGNGGGATTTDQEAAPPSDTTQTEPKRVTIATWGGVQEEIMQQAVAAPLAEQGIEAEFIFGTSGDRLARLYAAQGSPSIDIAILPVDRTALAIEDGVC